VIGLRKKLAAATTGAPDRHADITSEHAGAVDDIGLAADGDAVGLALECRQHHGHAIRVADVVGVMPHHVFTITQIQAAIEQTRQAFRLREDMDFDAFVAFGVCLRQFAAAVGRTVIEHQQAPIAHRLRQNAVQRFGEKIQAIFDW